MGVMSIRLDDQKKKMLKVIASVEGKTIGSLVSELVDDYLERNKKNLNRQVRKDRLEDFLQLSETSFSEWENEEDAVYDNLQ